MEVVHPQVAGIDVHKKVIWVAVRLPGEGPGQRTVTVRRFKTFWRSLQKVAAWLAELGVTDAAMESHRGVLVAGLPCADGRRDRGVRVQRGAHAQRPGPQDGLVDRTNGPVFRVVRAESGDAG